MARPTPSRKEIQQHDLAAIVAKRIAVAVRIRKRKIDVTTAGSGEEALELIDKQRPSLVLLDVKMTGIDGVETLKRIKEKDSTIQVIMVTGTKPDERSLFDTCKSLGALDYIHKPLELDELERVVMATLREIK